jgi:hypothetical protein
MPGRPRAWSCDGRRESTQNTTRHCRLRHRPDECLRIAFEFDRGRDVRGRERGAVARAMEALVPPDRAPSWPTCIRRISSRRVGIAWPQIISADPSARTAAASAASLTGWPHRAEPPVRHRPRVHRRAPPGVGSAHAYAPVDSGQVAGTRSEAAAGCTRRRVRRHPGPVAGYRDSQDWCLRPPRRRHPSSRSGGARSTLRACPYAARTMRPRSDGEGWVALR